MKSTIVIFLAVYIIIHHISQGLLLRVHNGTQDAFKAGNITTLEETKIKGQRGFIVSVREPYISKINNGTVLVNNPLIVRRKVTCLCQLPVCKCLNTDPESWYVKWAQPINWFNDSDFHYAFNYTKHLVSKNNSKPFFPNPEYLFKFYHLNPRLVNLAKQKEEDVPSAGCKFEFISECSQCKLQSHEDNKGVLLKCTDCGEIYLNKIESLINFSKIITKRQNTLKLHTKFVQVNSF